MPFRVAAWKERASYHALPAFMRACHARYPSGIA